MKIEDEILELKLRMLWRDIASFFVDKEQLKKFKHSKEILEHLKTIGFSHSLTLNRFYYDTKLYLASSSGKTKLTYGTLVIELNPRIFPLDYKVTYEKEWHYIRAPRFYYTEEEDRFLKIFSFVFKHCSKCKHNDECESIPMNGKNKCMCFEGENDEILR
nr:MAG: hypothetical protein [Lokiarchaeota virus Fenrir Meg22_1012]URC17245.1 MAG: hypothetical protein [Lokiarchaeota virus Fenrir Meg22_1214]